MENIIKKAEKGGYPLELSSAVEVYSRHKDMVCDPLFWQALGKACGWKGKQDIEWVTDSGYREGRILENCEFYALRFHEINLTEGWDKAVEYLSALIKE